MDTKVDMVPHSYLMPWTIEAKNTFLNVQALGELTLQRATTDPVPPLDERLSEESTSAGTPTSFSASLPPPPFLEFESMETADPFEHPSSPPALAAQPMYVALPIKARTFFAPPPPPLVPPPVIESAPPTRPPEMQAPSMDAPGAPQAPKAPPSRTPGTSVAELAKDELNKPGMLVRTSGACRHVHWAVDARKLERQDKQVVSPVFTIDLPENGPTPFKIVLYAKAGAVDGKRGAGFVKVQGRGRVVLKCEAQLPEACADIAFRIGVGRDSLLQPFRGPMTENFLEHTCHGLPASEEEWHFAASIDENHCFLVSVEMALQSSYAQNPNLWWSPLDKVE
jgi:hypothetical protein